MMHERPLLPAMTHPAVIGAVALLIINDHLLKPAWPSWTTGKLSDVAGLIFFPILVSALIELATGGRLNTRATLALTIAMTAVLFAGLQLSSTVGAGYQLLMGVLQWPFRLIANPTAQLAGVQITPDPTDLLALPALMIPWRIGTTISEPASKTDATELEPAS